MESKPKPNNGSEFNTASTFQLTVNEVGQSKEQEARMYEKAGVREGQYTTSDCGAFLHVIKSSMGSGFLAMPYAFHNAGLLAGFIGTALIAFICSHACKILVTCSQELCYIQQIPKMTYAETIESCFRIGAGKRFAKYASAFRHVFSFFMFFTYYGVNTVYVILIATTFQQVVENHTDISLNIRWYALALVLVVLPVGIVRHVKFLVPFSAIANVLLLVGCVLTMYFVFQDLPPVSSRPMVESWTRWPLFFSTALFGMEGIGTIMPIENSMRKPKHFLGCPGVLYLGMVVVASFYLFVGFFGYLRFGEGIQGNITLNLPKDMLSESVKLSVALAILFTYGLQLTASMEIVWDYAKDRFSEKEQESGYYIVRTLMILGTVAIGILVPNLSPVLSLVGAFGFSSLGLLFPAIIEIVTFWERGFGPYNIILVKNILLIFGSAIAMICGSIASIAEIVDQYSLS